jgi:hypothetical protein
MIQNAEYVLNQARMYLNDNATTPQVWSDSVLMPMLQRAHEEMQVKLKQSAAPLMKSTFLEIIPAGNDTFTNPPNDLEAPIEIWSAGLGGNSLSKLTEVMDIPELFPFPPGNMIYWKWDGVQVIFLPANIDQHIWMSYWRSLPVPQSGSDSIIALRGEIFLSPRTAAIAMATVGEEVSSATAAGNAETTMSQVILANRGRAPQMDGASIRP